MQAVQDFVRRYGGIMTAYIFLGCGIWMVGMIVLPQLLMLEKSLTYSDPAASARAAQIQANTDRLFVEITRAERAVGRLQTRIEALEAGEPDPEVQRGGATLLNPFAAGPRQPAEAATPETLRAEIVDLEAQIEGNRLVIAENDRNLEQARLAAAPRYGLANYRELVENDLNRSIFFKTIWASVLVTLICLVVCYPIAFYLAKAAPGEQAALLMLALIVPYWINEILRTFAWLMLLSDGGVINELLLVLGVIGEPIRWRQGNGAVIIGMTYAYILFMIFPIYNTIDTLDKNQIEAARDLGAPWWRIHLRVVIPHAKPGIAVGCIMTFMLAAGSYAVPLILGGTTSKWFTEVIYDAFNEGNDWGLGSAYAFTLLTTCIVFILVMMRLFKVSLQDIAK
ncbi:ABC transporter permease subunit [Algihabitans sp.]|uniref:ABC transporter permease n=1 Tax=Algihabitans sp. TaxID=2821514 RepID=UPI003BAC40A4